MPDDDALDPLTPSTDQLTGTVMRGASWAFAGYALTQALTLGFYLALARLATPQDFGEFAAAGVVVSVGLLFTDSGMLAAVIHRRDRVAEAASTAVVATAVAGLAFSLLALAVAPLVGSFFNSPKVGELSAAMSGLLLLRSFQVVPEALLQRRFSFLRRMIVEPLQATALGIAAVVATANGLGAWGLVIGFYAAAITDVVLSWLLARWRPQMRLMSFGMWKELVSYGRHVVAFNAVHRLGEQLPNLLIGRYVGEASLGQFRYADRISSTPLALVVSAGAYVLFPAFSRISGDSQRFTPAFLRSLRWFLTLAAPLGMVLLPLGVPLAVLFFGETWREAGYACMALSGFAVAASVISIESEALKAIGRPEVLTRIHIVATCAMAIAMIVLLPLGMIGVAAGVSLGSVLGAAYGLRRVALVVGVSVGEMLRQMFAPLTASLFMAALLLPIELFLVNASDHGTVVGLLLLGVEMTIAGVLYLGALTAMAPGTIRDSIELFGRLRRGQ